MQEVGQWCRIFKGVRRIHVEEAAAVGANMFDRLERGDRAEDDLLLNTFDCAGNGLRIQGLWHALPHINEGDDGAERQQHAPQHPHEVHPVIADILRAGACQTTNEAARGRHTGGCPAKHQKGDDYHLRCVGETRFTAIRLPVGVGDERDGGIECLIGSLRRVAQFVQGQNALQAQQDIPEQHHGRIGKQQGQAVTCPVHGFFGIDAQHAVTQPLHDGMVFVGKRVCQPAPHEDRQRGHQQQGNGVFKKDVFHLISPQSWRKARIRPTVAAKKAMVMPINSRSCMKASPSGSKFFRIQEGVAQINEQAKR